MDDPPELCDGPHGPRRFPPSTRRPPPEPVRGRAVFLVFAAAGCFLIVAASVEFNLEWLLIILAVVATLAVGVGMPLLAGFALGRMICLVFDYLGRRPEQPDARVGQRRGWAG